MSDVVTCPAEECDGAFDPVEASTAGRPSVCCPTCERTWVELHRLVDPDTSSDDSSFEIGFNGEIIREDAEVEA